MIEEGSEKIAHVLQTFPESFMAQFGRKITKAELIKHLETLYSDRMKQQLNAAFGGLRGLELSAAIKTIQNGSFEFIEDPDQKTAYKFYKDYVDQESFINRTKQEVDKFVKNINVQFVEDGLLEDTKTVKGFESTVQFVSHPEHSTFELQGGVAVKKQKPKKVKNGNI